jgi:tetratricopeptide (TPR) repeat protein
MVDPEVAKYETAILKLKASCPPTPSQSHSSCHDDDCDDYQLHVAKIAKVYDALGNYYFSCRAWQDAIYAFSQALTMFRVAHNGDMNQDPAIASTYINLGNTYWKVDGHGRHKEASVCMEQALRIRRVTLGSDDLETSAALHLNGQALCLLGDHESLTKAKHLLGEALEIRQDCHLVGLEQGGSGDDMHMLGMEVARTESLVGHAHKGLGENEDALHMYIEALRQKVTVLNTKQHSSVVASLVDIANLYRSMDGRLSDALDMYQQVLEIQSAIIVNSAEQEHEHRNNNSSADYMDVGMTLHTLGNISRELGNKVADAGADAQTYYSRAAIMYKQAGRDVNHNCFVLLRQSMSQCR